MKGEFDFGRDPDEFAMSMDRRSLAQRVKDLIEKITRAKKGSDYTREENGVLQNIGREAELL